MPVINLLDSSIYNRIAAGEVVERPASVIKELVENAIDAGAKRIDVSVSSGGRVNMTVTDDGCGIAREDLKTAFLPHATSKIKKVEDLDSIATLGFRGEALASIAAVGMVTVRSRAEGSPEAWTLSVRGGEFSEIEPCALERGTVFSVDHLFFNAPARAKFLKSDRTEEGEITDLMEKFILSRPDLSFTYQLNGKTVFRSEGKDLYGAMYCVYGLETLENCLPVDRSAEQGYKLFGYVGKPSFSKPNRTGQTLFVNGRTIVNPAVSACMSNAYANYLMKRQYPFYVLSLTLPPEEVDVNVHPNKREVRFEYPQRVIGFVYNTVHQLLIDELEKKPFFPAAEPTPPPIDRSAVLEAGRPVTPQGNREKYKVRFRDEGESVGGKSVADLLPEAFRPLQIGDLKDPPEISLAGKISLPEFAVADPGGRREEQKESFEEEKSPSTDHQKTFNNQNSVKNSPKFSEENEEVGSRQALLPDPDPDSANEGAIRPPLAEQSEWRYVGTVFSTYLIAERGDTVCLIDQHAAHERLLYDRLTAAARTHSTVQQKLLIPFVKKVNAREEEVLKGEAEEFRKLGFDLEIESGEIKVFALPLDLVEMDLKTYFDEVLFDLFRGGSAGDRRTFKEMLMQKACKAAVKGNRELSRSEAELLLLMLEREGTVPLCPHGRPILLSLTRRELEKKFKRIVD